MLVIFECFQYSDFMAGELPPFNTVPILFFVPTSREQQVFFNVLYKNLRHVRIQCCFKVSLSIMCCSLGTGTRTYDLQTETTVSCILLINSVTAQYKIMF